jgi:hypothetical protein
MPQRHPRRVPDGPRGLCHGGRGRLPRLGEPPPCKNDVDHTEYGGNQTRGGLPEMCRGGSDRRAYHDAGRGGRGQPAECTRPIAGGHSVGHIGLSHSSCAAAGALNNAGEVEQPHAVGQAEHHVGQSRGAESDQQRGPAPVPV